MDVFNLHGDEWNRTEERILLSRPGPMLDYWDGED